MNKDFCGVKRERDESRRQLEESQRKLECCMCMDATVSILFLPCRHLSVCEECAGVVSECPTCRVTIEDRVSVYF